MAFCRASGQVASAAKDMLITDAGFALTPTPSTLPPDAHVIEAATSDSSPPRQDNARTGWMLTPGATSAITPAVAVPCQVESRTGATARQSPGSRGFASRPTAPNAPGSR